MRSFEIMQIENTKRRQSVIRFWRSIRMQLESIKYSPSPRFFTSFIIFYYLACEIRIEYQETEPPFFQ